MTAEYFPAKARDEEYAYVDSKMQSRMEKREAGGENAFNSRRGVGEVAFDLYEEKV